MIKPYASTLDALLDTAHLIGDFVLILAAWPWHAAVGRYRRWRAPKVKEDFQSDSTTTTEVLTRGIQATSSQVKSRPRSRTICENPTTAAEIKARLGVPPPAVPADSQSGHQIWYPPTPSYEDDEASLPQFRDASVPQLSVHIHSSSDSPLAPSLSPDSEWRKYPDFPSAYPPTPVVQPKNFRIVAPVPKRPSDVINFADISEEEDSSDSQMEDQKPTVTSITVKEETQPGFCKSLLQPRESLNPDSGKRLGDEDETMIGVQILVEGEDMMMSDEEDEEGNSTLRTPRALRKWSREDMDMDGSDEENQDSFSFSTPQHMRLKPDLLKPRPDSMFSIQSGSSWQSKVTALSTDHDGSSLQTQGSESESSRPTSDTSSIAGRKRPLPQSRDSQATVRVRVRAPTMSRSSSSGDAQPFPKRGRGGRTTQARRPIKTDDEGREEDETDITSEASVVKKRKIIGSVDVGTRPRKQAASRLVSSVPVRKPVASKGTVPPPVRRTTRMGLPKTMSSTPAATSKVRAGAATATS